MPRTKKLAIIVSILVIAGLAYYVAVALYSSSGGHLRTQTITVASTTIEAEIAETEKSRVTGLSGRPNLAQGKGMLFIFPNDGNWGIWMKDMQFPIDIVWIDATGAVIGVFSNVRPESYPDTFYPPGKTAKYVLELPAGYAILHGIVAGTSMSLPR
jgi:uncharacterized membrane protein (UPF0127 family)